MPLPLCTTVFPGELIAALELKGDWEQIRRWNISRSRASAGSTVASEQLCGGTSGESQTAMIDWCAWKKSGLEMGNCYCQSANYACSREPMSKTAARHDDKDLVNGPSGLFGGEDVAGSISPRSLPVCTGKRVRVDGRQTRRGSRFGQSAAVCSHTACNRKEIEILPIRGRENCRRQQYKQHEIWLSAPLCIATRWACGCTRPF